MLDEISSSTHIFRPHLDYALGVRVLMTHDNLQTKLADNERLLRKIPIAGTISRQVLLLTLAGDLDGARWHLRRLLKFAPLNTSESIDEIRRFIKQSPDAFGKLGPILDEELAAAPKASW